jgi:hypothetical protein
MGPETSAYIAKLEARVEELEAKALKCPHCDLKLVVCDEAGQAALDSLAEDKARENQAGPYSDDDDPREGPPSTQEMNDA